MSDTGETRSRVTYYKTCAWGTVTKKCVNCYRPIVMDGRSVSWLKHCNNCAGIEVHICMRCGKAEHEHRHVQGRRFCKEPYIGPFVKPDPLKLEFEDVPF